MTRPVRDYPNHRFAQQPYDLVREMFIAIGIIGLVIVILAAIFSTPDVPALTAKQVTEQAPRLLVQTALDDLSQQDAISTYGPPYNQTPGAAQRLGFFSPQEWAGVQLPIHPAESDVLHPLQTISVLNPLVGGALRTWNAASGTEKQKWLSAVSSGLGKATVTSTQITLPGTQTAYGPLPTMLNAYLELGNSGLLESAIDGAVGPMPAVNRTKSLLLLQDTPAGQYADKLDMTGDEWGIIKETGNYPGAVWLWYYTLLYQIPPFNSSAAADLLVVMTVAVVTILLMLIPFIPGLRSIPRWIGLYRFIWRSYYRENK